MPERVDALLLGGGIHDRHPEPLCETVHVDSQSSVLCKVEHGHGHYYGKAEFQNLVRDEQVALEIGRVDDHDDCFRPVLLRPPQEHVERQAFVRRMRCQRVDSREVEEFDPGPARRKRPNVSIDRDARVVGDPLA